MSLSWVAISLYTSIIERIKCEGKSIVKNGPRFSHIFYADVLMLFAKENSKNYNAVLEVLDNFCNMAGQKININKLRIFFSPNVIGRKKNTICRKLGMVATQNLGRYLGFPLLHQGRNGNAFNFVIERV